MEKTHAFSWFLKIDSENKVSFHLFQEMYGNHPMNLVRVVKNCLATEQRLVQQTEMVGDFLDISEYFFLLWFVLLLVH